MIRLIQRHLIIPRGDTGSFTIPAIGSMAAADAAIFTIFDTLTHTKVHDIKAVIEDDKLRINFTHNDTVNLKPGNYVWDIKFYKNPVYLDDQLVNGDEIDSYYAGYRLPQCEIRETGDTLLVSSDAPQATLSSTQLDIINAAITTVNNAIQQTQANVEHYPVIRDEEWYVWDAEANDYVDTGVAANGIVGNGIASAVLNDDYTLTLNFTDGTAFTSPSIRGEAGNGINDIVLNNDFTLTISYTNGESYTTPSIRGPVGATPQFSIGTVQDGAVAAASITGTAENPVLNLTLPNAHVPTRVSQLENDANYAIDANYVHTDNNYTTIEKEKLNGIAAGAEVNVNADWNANGGDAQILNKPTKVSDFTNDAGYLTEHQDISGKADKSEIPTKVSQLQNDSGYLTSFTETDPTVPAWAKAAQKPTYTAAEVGATTEQEVSGMIAEAIGQINSFDMTVVQSLPTQDISTHTIYLVPKTGETNDVYDEYVYINDAWEMVGNTQIDLSDYALKSELPDVPVQDVQINGVSILSNSVANVPIANTPSVETDSGNLGLIKISKQYGFSTSSSGILRFQPASSPEIKEATGSKVIVPIRQHASTFYGLAKAAGDTTQSQSSNAVGTYTDEAKAAIQTMLDVPSNADVAAKQDTLTFDSAPTANSTNPVTSGGVYSAIANVNTMKIHICAQVEYDAETGIPTIQNPDTQTFYLVPGGEGNNMFIEWVYVNGSWERFGSADVEVPVQDVQVNGVSIVSSGVANVPVASNNNLGAVKLASNCGLFMDGTVLRINKATSALVKAGDASYYPIVPIIQHAATFYGLSKVAGVDLASETVTLGTYPETSKTAIRAMIGATSSNVIAVQDTQPTDPDTKIWLPETAETPVTVPTVAEMNAALANKLDTADAGLKVVRLI